MQRGKSIFTGRPAVALSASLFAGLSAGVAILGMVLFAGPIAGQTKKSGKPVLAKTLRPVASFASIADPKARSVALFAEASKVFLHPRCTNCHSASTRPRRGDRQRSHRPRVSGGKEGKGTSAMQCATCHSPRGLIRPGAPIVEGWRLAPVGAGWRKKSAGDICRQVRNKNTNGGMDLKALQHHLAKDKLIAWSWNPGGKRAPAPGSQRAFLDLTKAWADTGAHCPE